MRKLIVAAIIVIMSSAQMMAGITISLTVEFGHRDAENNCIERGFCRVGVTVGRGITATVNDNTGNLEFTFPKSAAMTDVYGYQFANGVFEIPVDYVLPADVCAKLGIDKYTFKRGRYKVTETKEQYSIVFPKN